MLALSCQPTSFGTVADVTKRKEGERLKALREAVGWTQQDAADVAGSSVSSVSQWERGEKRPGHNYLRLLATAWGISVDDFVFPDRPMPRLEALPRPVFALRVMKGATVPGELLAEAEEAIRELNRAAAARDDVVIPEPQAKRPSKGARRQPAA